MKLVNIILTIIIAACVSLGMYSLLAQPAATGPTAETAYDRIKRTGVIRCGYGLWAGLMEKDPNTGALSGPAYDYVNKLAEKLALRAEWAQEVDWPEAVPALQNGRIDVMCSGLWANSARAREIDFVQPIYYNAIYAYARADDTRFDNRVAEANRPDVRVAVIDGSTEGLIQKQDFPNTTAVFLGQYSSNAELLENVATNKADLVFMDPGSVAPYIQNNPGKIKKALSAMPLRSYPLAIAVNGEEQRLKRMFDIATEEMLNSNLIEPILQKYAKSPDSYLRVAPGYVTQ